MKDFNYSYWEIKQYFQRLDLIIIGGGIVGLSTAISFKKNNPKAKVLVLEKGIIPNGASTKNAGFACFGSAGELLDDLRTMPDSSVWETVKMRWEGLRMLRNRLGDKHIGFKQHGGYELYSDKNEYDFSLQQIPALNRTINDVIGIPNCFESRSPAAYPFGTIRGIIFNTYEGQLDTGLMMQRLLDLTRRLRIEVLNNVNVLEISETTGVELKSNLGTFKADKVVVATNGFARSLLSIEDIQPARAQVLITKPIENLKIKGTYHFFKGYYYFRNIDDRILFGGGRNLDFLGESTSAQGLNPHIQAQLDILLKEMIFPHTKVEVDHRWSGIMGVGKEKKPIIQSVGKNVLAAVRMGGMGIAIGSFVGEKAAEAIS